MEDSGVKFLRKNVLEVYTETEDGMLKWLEKGNEKAGLEHFRKHFGEIEKGVGIKGEDAIIDYIGELLKSEPKYKLIMDTGPCNIYEIAKQKFCILAYGDNGFIVSFYYVGSKNGISRILNNAIKILKQ